MNMKKTTLFLVNPGIVPSVTFVTCYEADPIGAQAEIEDEAPAAASQGSKQSWTQAFIHLPKVMNRVVRQSLKRAVLKPGVTA